MRTLWLKLSKSLAALVPFFVAPISFGATFDTVQHDSLFSVVVYKEGVASGFAHNHLVFAKAPRITRFEVPDGKPIENGSFTAEADVAQIFSDDYTVSRQWIPTLQKAGLISDDVELSEIKAKNRADIEETMRGDSQLDQAKFPKITFSLKGLTAKNSALGELKTTHEGTIAVTIHGVTREIKAPVRLELVGNDLSVLCSAPMLFTDFGIEPVSTALGMVRNQNQFQLFVMIKAHKSAH